MSYRPFRFAPLVVMLALAGCVNAPPMRDAAPAKQALAGARNPNCLQYTGTRVPHLNGECQLGIGRIYTVDDLERTGAFTVGGGLGRLIP